MADYIEREAFLKTWCKSYCRPKQNCRDDCSFYDAITQFPTANARENVPGEWIPDDDDDCYELWKCSVCGKGIFDYRSDFCPYCGADMRGGEKDG